MKIAWLWSYGEKQQRSKRDSDKSALMKLNNENAESMKNAHSMSLNHDENTWDMMSMLNNQSQLINNKTQMINNQEQRKNNREELNFKVSDRQMMQQIGNNPFLENNYQSDIANHNVFLIPKNSK